MGCQSSCWWWRASILGGHTQITIISNYCKPPYYFCIAIHHLKEKKLRSGSPPLPSEASVPLSILLPAAHSGPSLQQYAALRIGNLPPDKKVAGWWWQGDVIPYPLYHFCTTWKMDGNRWMFMTFFWKTIHQFGVTLKSVFGTLETPQTVSFFVDFIFEGESVGLNNSLPLLTITRHSWCQWNSSRGSRWGDSYLASQTPTWHEPWNPKSWLVYDGILILAYSNPHIIGK